MELELWSETSAAIVAIAVDWTRHPRTALYRADRPRLPLGLSARPAGELGLQGRQLDARTPGRRSCRTSRR